MGLIGHRGLKVRTIPNKTNKVISFLAHQFGLVGLALLARILQKFGNVNNSPC